MVRTSTLFLSLVLILAFYGCDSSLDSGGTGGTGGDGGPDPVCGDGEVSQLSEECDDGDNNSDTTPDACRTDCSNPICGDDVVDTGEECDGAVQCVDCVSVAICGDEIVGGSEECEPNIDADCHAVGHFSECTFIRTAFRMTGLTLVDPGFWIGAPGACGSNLESSVNEGLAVSVNGDWASTFAPPESLDGLVDLGFVFTMAPLRQGNDETSSGAFVLSDCDFPGLFMPTPCSPTVTLDPFSVGFSVTSQTEGTCLGPIEGSTGPGLVPPGPVRTVEAGDGACWVSDPFEWTLALGTIAQIPLIDVRVAANWGEFSGFDLMTNGLIRGFLTRAEAETIQIELLGGLISDDLANILSPAGGDPDLCQHADTGPNGEDGWYLYLHFGAFEMPWEGGPMCGNGALDTGGEERDETCDTGLAPGETGSCEDYVSTDLNDCDDNFACTDDTLNAGDQCAPTCFHRAFMDNADGCCPALAPEGSDMTQAGTAGTNDADCVGLCDDGTLQGFEACDDTEGTACDDVDVLCADDGDACTVEEDFLVVIGTNPQIKNLCVQCPEGACECKRTTIRAPDDGTDGCCPQRCVTNPTGPNCGTDTNCPPDA